MFFISDRRSAVRETAEKASNRRDEVKQRLAQLNSQSEELAKVAQETQVVSCNLTDRIKRELKVAKKTLISMASMLTEGAVLFDHAGRIIHVNTAAEKILRIDSNYLLGKAANELLSLTKPIPPFLSPSFFEDLSREILDKSKANINGESLYSYSTTLKVVYPAIKLSLELDTCLTTLDNDPESLDDVAYIFIFTVK